MLTVGSLFAGIGGFDLGLERTGGFKVVWQCEIDPYCQRVLAKHWPDVKRYGDIRELRDVERVDVLCGGFPCQPVSVAGGRLGQSDERWLWPEFARVIGMVRPKYVVLENTPGLLSLGMGDVIGQLSEIGYDAEWDVIPAAAVGAPHIRERVWIVAYPQHGRMAWRRGIEDACQDGEGSRRVRLSFASSSKQQAPTMVADSHGKRLQERFVFAGIPRQARWDDDGKNAPLGGRWPCEPSVGRVANGIPKRVDRIKSLGNAVVPQVVEWIGNRILEYEKEPSVREGGGGEEGR